MAGCRSKVIYAASNRCLFPEGRRRDSFPSRQRLASGISLTVADGQCDVRFVVPQIECGCFHPTHCSRQCGVPLSAVRLNCSPRAPATANCLSISYRPVSGLACFLTLTYAGSEQIGCVLGPGLRVWSISPSTPVSKDDNEISQPFSCSALHSRGRGSARLHGSSQLGPQTVTVPKTALTFPRETIPYGLFPARESEAESPEGMIHDQCGVFGILGNRQAGPLDLPWLVRTAASRSRNRPGSSLQITARFIFTKEWGR